MTHTALRLVIGLGNPGAEYSETRHNAGFWFCERLARELGVSFAKESRFKGWVAKLPKRASSDDQDCWLLMPATYMNHSGQSVRALMQFYRIEPSEILVAYDELDLPPGHMRLKKGGSSTHNGIKDINAHLGGPDYWRLRIGIGHPGDRGEVVNYVLKPARKEEQSQIDAALDRALPAWPHLHRGDMEAAMRIVNAKPPAA